MSDKHVSVDREDLKRVLMHCRETWPKNEPGYDAVTRCEYALGHRKVWVNLFRIEGKLCPSVTYGSFQEAYDQSHATSFAQTIAVLVPRE